MHARTKARSVCIVAFLHLCIWSIPLCARPQAVDAAERYALVVTGASGGPAYAEKFDRWRDGFVKTLRGRLGYDERHLSVLADHEGDASRKATRENIQRVLGGLRKTMTKDDQLLVLLIGHGTSGDGEEGKFNLVGPDLTASAWAALVKPIAGRIVFIDTTGASFPFLGRLAGPGRIVLTATDSAAQQLDTVFPEFVIKAFDEAAADEDKNGRVSIWEAFSYASAGVRQWYEQHAQLPTERPLLDDTGAGVGREAQNPGTDGAVARVTYLDSNTVPAAGNPALAALLRRRTELERELDDLRARKPASPSAEYDAALEKLLLEIARLSMEIRSKS